MDVWDVLLLIEEGEGRLLFLFSTISSCLERSVCQGGEGGRGMILKRRSGKKRNDTQENQPSTLNEHVY